MFFFFLNKNINKTIKVTNNNLYLQVIYIKKIKIYSAEKYCDSVFAQ